MDPAPRRGTRPHLDSGVQGGPLPQRPAVPAALGHPARGNPGDRLQPQGLEPLAEFYGIPFYYIPVTPDTKADAEAQLLALVAELDVELVVLARYMQVLSDDLCNHLAGRAINIHHSFLPSFKGAKPYHQAHARGVKIIGATAHYVTAVLDEGPIIEQEVIRVEHGHSVEKFVSMGRAVEARTLAQAVQWHAEHRVLLDGHRTVVFD